MDNKEIKENVVKENNKQPKFKSKIIENLMGKYEKGNLDKKEKDEQPKDAHAINLSDILIHIDSLSAEEISNIISDVNSNNIIISVNKDAIEMLNNKELDQEKMQKILTGLTSKINIDINSIADLSVEGLNSIKQRCTINKVYVNTGYDQAAKDGYDVNKYLQIRNNADLMRETALGKNKDSMSEMDRAKRIYKYVIENTKYDYDGLAASNHKSRNLENFFTKGRHAAGNKIMGKGRAVCAGVASGLQNMLECEGIECQYIQGWATVGSRREYHAWLKAKIDGKWVNLDPTWDMCKVGPKPFYYFARDDKFFRKTEHSTDYNYNPTYSRGANISKGMPYYNVSNDVKFKDPMRDLISREYVQEYLSSRSEGIDAHYAEISSRLSEEEHNELIDHKIPTAISEENKKLTLKQKLADFLYKGKHLKNISFIKKFVENNSLKCKADAKQKADKEAAEKRCFIEKVDGKLAEANKNYEQPKITISKNDTEREAK